MYKIVKKERLNDVVELMEVHAPMVARKCEPGQFIILRVGEDGERIPLTIADYDREAETITIIYQIVGVPTDLHKSNHVVGIAGGVGSAPLYPQLKKLAEMGVDVDVIIGGREAQYVLWADKFKAFCKNVYVMTDDGSLGEKGFGTVKLQELIDSGDPIDEVIAIGPVPMMKAVVGVTKPHNLKTMVSLNPIMIDGTGMCGCCRVTVDGKIKFACVDGPDFDGLSVDFDELMARQRMFKEEEHQVDANADRICNLMGGAK